MLNPTENSWLLSTYFIPYEDESTPIYDQLVNETRVKEIRERFKQYSAFLEKFCRIDWKPPVRKNPNDS